MNKTELANELRDLADSISKQAASREDFVLVNRVHGMADTIESSQVIPTEATEADVLDFLVRKADSFGIPLMGFSISAYRGLSEPKLHVWARVYKVDPETGGRKEIAASIGYKVPDGMAPNSFAGNAEICRRLVDELAPEHIVATKRAAAAKLLAEAAEIESNRAASGTEEEPTP